MNTSSVNVPSLSVSIYECEDLKIEFNPKINRISIQNSKKSWISCTSTAFQILLSLMRNGGAYEKISIEQITSTLEITKIGGNFCLVFNSKSIQSFLLIKYLSIPKLIHQSEIILAKINGVRMRYKSNESITTDIPQSLKEEDNPLELLKKNNPSPSRQNKRPANLSIQTGLSKKKEIS